MDAHPNSNIMYETLTGDDITIDFADFLNKRDHRATGVGPAQDRVAVHSAMEARLGL